MNRFVKTALLWLLALALPVQGWAAATQLSCAPMMHQTTAAPVDDTAVSHASHDMSGQAMHHDMHAKTSDDAHADSPVSYPVSPKHADMKCSACAACNVGMAALPSVHDWPLPSAGSSHAVATPATSFLAHIPDGIKRPPRSVLV